MLRLPLAATLLAAITSPLAAQAFSCPSSGPGSRISSFDLDALTNQTLHNGLAVLNGEIFVATDPTTGPKPVYVFDFQGNLLRQFDQPPTASATVNGYLDGATDGFGTLIWCHDDGVEFTDVNGNPVTTVVAANGPQTVGANPLTGQWEVGLGIVRGIAFDPAGNGGNGSILVGDLTDSIVEIDLDGNILRIYGNLAFWDVNGLALADGGNILVNSDDNDGSILTINRATGLPTGFSASLDRNGLEGAGCELIDDPNGIGTIFITVNENTGDEVAIYQFERFAGVDESGIALTQRVDMDPFGTSRATILPGATQVSFQLDAPFPVPGLMFLNFGPDANVCADNTILGSQFAALTDLFAATPFSSPSGAPIELPLVANTPLTFPSTPFLGLPSQENFRAQAVVALPGIPFGFLPVVPTNEVRFSVRPNIVGVTVAADGANTFNSDPTSGFWSVSNSSTDPNKAITSVVFDWVGAVNNPTQSTQEFDTDQTGMADNFENGNSTVASCSGTYRNGSDVLTGLVYDMMNTPTGATCDPTANTGWIGTNATTVAGDFQTLEWRFAGGTFLNGATFEVDVDTDGTGTGGDDMRGMIVIVTFADGTQVVDELVQVGTDRSEVLF